MWRIYWLDSRHPSSGEPFVGSFADGRGTFLRHTPRPDGTTALSRIVFQPGDTNTVDRSLSVSSDGGAQWTTIWRMHFRPSRPGPGAVR